MDSSAATTALVALGACAAFEGTALFLSAADPVPFYSDETQSPQELLRDWRRMFPGAMGLQSKVVVLGAASAGVTAWGLRDTNGQAAAGFGAALAANVGIFAYTMLRIMPLNNRLLPEGEVEKVESEAGIRALLKQWGEMHGVRTILGGVAMGGAAYGLHALLTSK